jgi:hypothetical protein
MSVMEIVAGYSRRCSEEKLRRFLHIFYTWRAGATSSPSRQWPPSSRAGSSQAAECRAGGFSSVGARLHARPRFIAAAVVASALVPCNAQARTGPAAWRGADRRPDDDRRTGVSLR